MVLLLNLLLPALLIIIFLIGLKKFNKETDNNKKIKNACVTLIIMLTVFIVYSNVQPSYLPKGSVPNLQKVPIELNSSKPVQNLTQGRTDEQRQQRVEEIITVRDEVKRILEENNKDN